MGNLYVVATPIGNLEDITMRAIRILKEVDLILCENVSEAHRLLKHYEIKTATTNYYSNSKLNKIDKIINMLQEGKRLAIISDAGTPCISDPGSLLINEIYKSNSSFDQNKKIKIISVPGPTAVAALYSISGVIGNRFAFYGYAPQKKGRETFFKQAIVDCNTKEIPIIFYESVHRIEKCLEQMRIQMQTQMQVTIGRELTKIYEEVVQGDIDFVINYFQNNKDKIKGEFIVMISYIKA